MSLRNRVAALERSGREIDPRDIWIAQLTIAGGDSPKPGAAAEVARLFATVVESINSTRGMFPPHPDSFERSELPRSA